MNKSYKVGIISDTHGLLREEVIKILKTCDYIVHGGDINKKEVLDELKKIAPVFVVKGNNDKGEWAEKLPIELYFSIGKINFYMIHNKKDVPNNQENIDMIIFGHSHKYFYEIIDNIAWLNPGSCGKRRFNLPINLAIMTIENNDYKIERVEITNN